MMAMRMRATTKRVLSFIIMILLRTCPHSDHKDSGHNNADDEIRNDEIHDDIDLSNIMLPLIVSIAINDPVKNICHVIGPDPNGTKNPITVEATRIFEISAKYFASNSVWRSLNLMSII